MTSLIIVHPSFETVWPLAAEELRAIWAAQGSLTFVRLDAGDDRALGAIDDAPRDATRAVTLGVPVTPACLDRFGALREAAFQEPYAAVAGLDAAVAARSIRRYTQPTEGFWGQSVAEFALALTLCGLRRIPQLHHQIIADQTPWDYKPPGGVGRPGARGHQLGDDLRFTSGTVAGKRVRIVGAGNIASRYASFVAMLGADVAAWDPFASEPSFHRAGSRRERHLERLMTDAEIFAPLVPLTESTRGLVTAEHIAALPRGCLVVLATRAGVCDVAALRRRVCADEIALAADVFDIEPLPLGDELLGRHNVVHTPHSAGRTVHANAQWAGALADQFLP